MNDALPARELAAPLAVSPVQHRYLDLALGSARSLLEVLEQSIGIARSTARPAAHAARWLNLDEMVCDAVRAVTPSMGWKDFSVVYDSDVDTTEVLTDPLRLRQVVMNLASNAARHTARGHVGIRVELRGDGASARCRLEVEDTGSGIDPERLRCSSRSGMPAKRAATAGTGTASTRRTTSHAWAPCRPPAGRSWCRGWTGGAASTGPRQPERPLRCRAGRTYRPAATRSAAALSVRSQENSGSSRPKCP